MIFLGEIRMFAGRTPPANWAFCQGQELLIVSYPDLYGLLGARYGGDGITTFALPDLRGRVPVRMGSNAGINYSVGDRGGVERVTLSIEQIPSHTHALMATSNLATDTAAGTRVLAQTRTVKLYQTGAPAAALSADAVTTVGGGQSHTNMQPYLCINFIIALSGYVA